MKEPPLFVSIPHVCGFEHNLQFAIWFKWKISLSRVENPSLEFTFGNLHPLVFKANHDGNIFSPFMLRSCNQQCPPCQGKQTMNLSITHAVTKDEYKLFVDEFQKNQEDIDHQIKILKQELPSNKRRKQKTGFFTAPPIWDNKQAHTFSSTTSS